MRKINLTVWLSISAVLLAALYSWLLWGKPVEKKNNWFEFDTLAVARIQISCDTLKADVALASDGRWVLNGNPRLRVDQRKPVNLIKILHDLKVFANPVAEETASLKTYALTDSSAVHVRLADKDNNTIGEALVSYGFDVKDDYMRHPGENTIYKVAGKILGQLDFSTHGWLDHRIFITDVEPDSIAVKYLMGNKKEYFYTLVNQGVGWNLRCEEGIFPVKPNSQVFNNMMRQLNQLTVNEAIMNPSAEERAALKQPLLSVSMHQGQTVQKLSVGRTEKGRMIAMLNDYPDVLYGIRADNLDTFTRARQHFTGE